MKILALILLFCSLNSFAHEASFLTYNTGLAHGFVAMAKQRLPHIIDALKSEQSDVVCLQEVWKKKDRKKIIKQLKKIYPYSYYEKKSQLRASKKPVCKIKQLFGEGRFLTCMLNNCMGQGSDHQTVCSRTTCGPALEWLKINNRECASTLMAQVGRNTILSMYVLFEPFIRPGMFAYNGANGLLMLSKKPLQNKRFIDWKKESTLNHRGALVADINLENRKISVACTHLTANLENSIPYTGTYEGWESENLIQTNDLIKRSEDKDAIFMGDFNCSVANSSTGVESEFEQNCKQFSINNYEDPMTDLEMGPTFSLDNSLVEPTEHNLSLDHIFYKNMELVSSDILFQKRVLLDDGKKSVESNISDHFAFRVRLRY
jgi:endonuclease/exonuclease/phosphatase family metal-dependent hydrolase